MSPCVGGGGLLSNTKREIRSSLCVRVLGVGNGDSCSLEFLLLLVGVVVLIDSRSQQAPHSRPRKRSAESVNSFSLSLLGLWPVPRWS